jgi:ABC-type polysaccharide/polyol phosphate transport system ATPase subunit
VSSLSVDDSPAASTTAARRARIAAEPVTIQVRDVHKTFRIPDRRIDSLKERVTHPLARQTYHTLQALRGISFDVHRGEFFGIVGRNGSGKSTLLKIMASIYKADAGAIRMAGRLAPFIELGVGFNPELTARENVTLNGVLMGLGRRDAARRLDSVLDFAELREFADLKLKNYSSGMMVRLAFAVMVEADADVMLIDEVLAVGDASFSQKCLNVFRERRDAGRTIVLVTHDMSTVQSFCDRAMLLHDAELQYVGGPDETALRYFRLNFGGDADEVRAPGTLPEVNVRVIDTWLENAAGARITNVEQNERLYFNCIVEARRDLHHPVFGFHFMDHDGARLFGFNKMLDPPDGSPDSLSAGHRVHISGEVENRLLPGRYHIVCWISRNRAVGDLALHALRLLDFMVYGTEPGPGSLQLSDDVRVELIEPEADR